MLYSDTQTYNTRTNLRTSDQSDAEISGSQHTTLKRDGHLFPRQDSNPQSKQASERHPAYVLDPAATGNLVADTEPLFNFWCVFHEGIGEYVKDNFLLLLFGGIFLICCEVMMIKIIIITYVVGYYDVKFITCPNLLK
jgi:hypothetical protein